MEVPEGENPGEEDPQGKLPGSILRDMRMVIRQGYVKHDTYRAHPE